METMMEDFLNELETELHYIIDGSYYMEVERILSKIRNFISGENYKWHPARHLPTPRIPLKVRLSTGEIIDAIRPSYIAKYDLDDLGYRDFKGNRVDPVEWAIA